ncbi:prepilin-type N-terminal cleavage/methylation domain-containing protein [bacterium]|nr:prepilin-type N-terminal cleavage/methylation domain-containing protein [bacterium]
MTPRQSQHHRPTAGFTLVEMLVAVALVLLIMTMFAQIFQMAAGSISVQQGIAENDQQARMITGMIRGDLDKRSMRLVLPFFNGEDTRSPNARLDLRQGYFYYAENDPADKTDDVLQFTVRVTRNEQQSGEAPYIGRADSRVGVSNYLGTASRLSISGFNTSSINLGSNPTASQISMGDWIWVSDSSDSDGDGYTNNGLYQVSSVSGSTLNVVPDIPDTAETDGYVSFVNEPEFDDGTGGNLLGASSAAEVCYFLRSGTLYRRMLLIRDANSLDAAQPHYRDGSRTIYTSSSSSGNYPRNSDTNSTFWRDFDYSAFYFPGKTSSSGTEGAGVYFHSTEPSLYNGSDGEQLVINDTTSPVTTIPISLGIPALRFGHNPNTGLPREYFDLNSTTHNLTDDSGFIGRFLTQETASTAFAYPGYMPTNNPYTSTLTASSGLSHVIDDYEDSPAVRRGDDIVLPNVLAFDVQILDPNSNSFVDLGDDLDANNISFNASDRLNAVYAQDGNTGSTNTTDNRYRFDTWHPNTTISADLNGNGMIDSGETDSDPPFRPVDGSGNALPITAIQITIVYQSQVDGRIRQVTIVQSLQDSPSN